MPAHARGLLRFPFASSNTTTTRLQLIISTSISTSLTATALLGLSMPSNLRRQRQKQPPHSPVQGHGVSDISSSEKERDFMGVSLLVLFVVTVCFTHRAPHTTNSPPPLSSPTRHRRQGLTRRPGKQARAQTPNTKLLHSASPHHLSLKNPGSAQTKLT